MKVARLVVLLLALAGLIANSGRAFELEGYGGYYRYASSLAKQFQADHSPIYGIRFGSGARQILSGETTLGYGPAKDMRILLLMGNFLVNIPVDLVIPYVTLGTGTTIYLPKHLSTPQDLVLNTQTKFTLNYGGGFRYVLNPMLAARFDFRDYVTFDLDFDVKDAAAGQTGISVGTIHNTVIAGGLSLTF
jgi:hypothetical protein